MDVEEENANDDDVFNLAKENNEMGNHELNKKDEKYANEEMIDKIEKIEN